MLNLTLGIISLILHVVVVYYGWRMYKILNPVRYWSNAWLLYLIANLLILLRRFVGVFIIQWSVLCSPKTLIPIGADWYIALEYLLQITVSILLVLFGKKLTQLYSKYFNNGLKLKSLDEQYNDQKKK